jgi:hypothetical protein
MRLWTARHSDLSIRVRPAFAALALTITAFVVAPDRAFAQAPGPATPTLTIGPLVPFVQYGAPQRLAGGASLLLPIGGMKKGEMTYNARGIELQASAGTGGWRLAVGAFRTALPLWTADVLLTVTRTTADTRGAVPESTYVGVEAGIKAYVWSLGDRSCSHNCHQVLLLFAPSIGFAHRVDRPAGPEKTMFTWSAGGHILSLRF